MKKDYLKVEFDEVMILAVIILLLGVVIAQPGLPHQFYGKVVCQNNNSISNYTTVTLKYQDNIIKSTDVFNSTYGYNPLLLIWNISSEIKTLDFYVNDNFISSSDYIEGGVTNLDLVVDNSLCSDSNNTNVNPQNPSSSSGGGQNGPASALIYTKNPKETSPNIQNDTNGSIDDNKKNISDTNTNEEGSQILNLSPQKMNKAIALNISIFTLILMAIFALYSIRSLKNKSKSI
jgi:hypothetical protein